MTLSPEQRNRYHRHLLVPEIGEDGQERLLAARVLVVGAGGLGSAAAFYLAAAGTGTLGIVDADRVELSNLQRQILHRTQDLGQPKAASAQRTLSALNPGIRVVPHVMRLDEENTGKLLEDYDLVVDAVDNLPTRYLVNAACVQAGKPLIEAGVNGTEGFLTTILPRKGPCYRCLFPPPPAPGETGPGPLGVASPLPGVVGTMEAAEAIKLILGTGPALVGKILYVDPWHNEYRLLETVRAPECPICG